MQHIIGRQIIQLRLYNRKDAFRRQHQINEHYWNDILPLMEKLFDEATSEDETLYIELLEIDLGVLTEEQLSGTRWDAEIFARIADQLRKKLSGRSTGAKRSAGRQPAALGICRQWLYYMQNGYMPWNSLQVDANWMQKVLEALSTDYESITALRDLIRSDANAVSRIIEQHSESFLVQLVEILTARKQHHLSQLLDELEALYRSVLNGKGHTPHGRKGPVRNRYWNVLLEVSAADETSGEEQPLMQHILEKYFSRLLQQQILPEELTDGIPRLLPLIRLWQRKEMSSGREAAPGKETEIFSQEPEQVEAEKPGLKEEGIFVSNAGAVLLHPFLSTFFSRLQLAEAGAFRDLAAQQKALYMVHYLCTGFLSADEHELVVPKVLCGYPLKKPVKKHVRLTRDDKEEAAHLLEELIRQWGALKSTSPAGLREGFLQRGGKLMTKHDLFHIQVETDTIDILLDHLPWNLSIIKLPWVKDLIRVEWR